MTTTPIPAAPSLLPGEDTGASNSDGVIKYAGPQLVGHTLPFAAIALYDNAVATDVVGPIGAGILSGTADANGFYTIAPYPVLDDGKHSLTITATAPGEDPSVYSLPLAIVVDTAAPDAPTAPVLAAGYDTGASALDGISSKRVLQLTGTAEPGSMVALYNGTDTPQAPAQLLAQATAGTDGAYTITTGTLPDGVYAFTVKAMDLAGNIGTASAATSITVDSTLPAVPPAPTLSPGSDGGVSHSDGLTNDPAPVVTGTAEANATVELFDGSVMVGKATADGTGNYAISSNKLDDGTHALTVKAVDAAGNVSVASAALNVVIDTAAPEVTLTPTDGNLGAGSVPFTVHFSEAVGGVTASDFTLLATGTVTGSVQSVTGSGADYVVTLAGLSGQGTATLALLPGSITDLAGNAAVLKEQDTHAVSGTTQPTTLEVSTTPSGLLASGIDPSPSASGRVVAFTTLDGAELTTSPATDGVANVVVRDTVANKTALVSLDLDGAAANGASGYASISADGTEIAFASDATNLVDGGTQAGETNVYVATLTEGAAGPEVQSITLVSVGAGQQGEGVNGDGSEAFSGPVLSADGSTVAFDSTQALVPGAESGIENVYAENVATGAITLVSGGTGKDEYAYITETDPLDGIEFQVLAPAGDKAPGTGGDMDSDVTSISADGKLIAYESTATDLGGDAVQVIDGVSVPSRGYVYNTVTGTTTNIDGTAELDPSAEVDTTTYNTYDPVLSGDGSKVFYEVRVGGYLSNAYKFESLYQYTVATGVTTPVSVPTSSNREVYDFNSSASKGGGLLLFQDNPGVYADQAQYQSSLANPATGTMTALSPGFAERLTSSGSAYVFTEEPNGGGSDQLYETTLGVSAGIDPIGGVDAVDASVLAQAAAGSGLAVSGTTNAQRGSTVVVQIYGASASTSTLNSPAALGTVDGLGHWTATVPTALLQAADGNYALVVQVGTPAGNSFFSVRDFIVDTKAPSAPDAPKLDAGSDTSTASDGSATNQDTPTLTGTAEAGSTVTLYDLSSTTPGTALGTAVADGTGVYAVTASPLINGKHMLDVTATDAAGNVSAASDPVTVSVDTIVPDAPIAGLDRASDTGISQSDGITGNATPDVVGTAEAGTTVTLYDTDKVATLGTATVDANGKYRISASSLSDGAHTLTVTDTDAAGNVSPASVPLAVTIDTLPPFRPIITSITGALVSGKIPPLVTVSGTAEPNSKVTLQLDGGTVSLGETTAASDGDYSIDSDPLPPGDGQNLTVTAYDAAANASQPSLPADVDISDSTVPPPGTPPFTPTLLGLLTDGPIAGATVFADANGNGVRDAGEASAITGTTGQFTLYGPGGDLEATGGTDTTTGLGLPGPLFAPAGSTVIDPLTTLLYAFQQQTGASIADADAAVVAALGLLGGTDLTTLDPSVAPGAAAIADAKLADLAADVAAALSHDPTLAVSAAAVFGDVFQVLASAIPQLPGGSRLTLDDPVTLLSIVQTTAQRAGAGGGVPLAVATATEQIVAAGNSELDTDASMTGQMLLTAIAGIETVEQGKAAVALGQIGNDPTLAASLVPQYTGAPLVAQASVTASLITSAPRLASASDTGLSNRDTLTDDSAPTFTGTALPGSFVTLVELTGTYGLQGQVLGSTQTDTAGHYQIVSAPLSATFGRYFDGTPFAIAAVGSMTNQNLAVGAIINVPTGTIPQTIELESPVTHGQGNDPSISDATPEVASADDSGHSALLVQLSLPIGGTAQVFADGGTTPIGTGVSFVSNALLTLTTAPLSLGTHTLTVTETLDGGTQLTSDQTYTVNVTAPVALTGMASAIGPVADASVIEIDKDQLPDPGTDVDALRSVTQANGAYAATISVTANRPLTLSDGYDTITGLPLGGYLGADNTIERFYNPGRADTGVTPALTAPYDATSISPFSSIVSALDALDDSVGGVSDPDTIENTANTLEALGLDPAVDLATLDPLKQAQAGDPAPLLALIKLLDTVTVLTPLNGYSFAPLAQAIDGGTGLDLDSAGGISALITDGYRLPQIGPSAMQLGEIAAIVAAGNAAIDAHAKTANSLADTLSYAFAAERLEQDTVLGALNQADDQFDSADSDVYAGLVTADTGPQLDAAILAERGHSHQVISLVPEGDTTTDAARVTFAITFGEAVTGLAASPFQLVTTGLQGAAITAIAGRADTGDTTYDIEVDTGVGQGTVALTYGGGGVLTVAGKPITAGVFAPATTYLRQSSYFGGNPHGNMVAAGDFNGDGRPDAVLVAGANGIDPITVFLNTGTGGFQAMPSFGTDTGGDTAEAPIAVDVNGDGKTDLVVADYDVAIAEGYAGPTYGAAVTVFLGNGDGTFQQPINTPVDARQPSDMVAGDFNGDGKTDLALSDLQSNTLQILLGNGAGGFTPVASLATGQAPSNIVTADFNGDGRLDLASENSGDNTTAVFLGNGDGTFTAAPTVPMAADFAAFAAGDLNGDGIPDLVIGGGVTNPGEITVLLGNGDGTFTAIAPFIPDPTATVANAPRAIVIGDVNNDGIPDLVDEDYHDYSAVLLGKGDGTFRLGSENDNALGDASVVLADVDGDGRVDMLTPGEVSAPDVAADPGLNVLLNEPEMVVGSTSPAITIDRPAVAQPILSKTAGAGTLTQIGNAYTLDLGTLPQGAVSSVALALANMAAAPADSFDGLFATPAGTGFTLTGATLPAAIAAGSSYAGLSLAADTSTLGAHSETLTFAPRDVTNDLPVVDTLSPDATGGDPATVIQPPADLGGVDVALELTPLTLTITDDVASAGTLVAPTITGTAADQPTTDEASIRLFAAVAIADLNPNQTETVTVTQAEGADGTLSDPNAAGDLGILSGDVYSVSGTAAQVSTALQGLSFTPAAHQVAPGQAITTGFTIAVSDTAGQTATDATTSVVATAIDDAPVIGGTRSGQIGVVGQALQPFSQATLTDPDAGASISVTATLSAAGTATDADGTLSGTGLTRTGTGSYVLSAGSPAAEQALLQALVFTPAAGAVGMTTTTFSLLASDGTKSTADTATTVIVTTSSPSSGGQPGSSTPAVSIPVYKFFDTSYGTNLFTQSLSEAQSILANRSDLIEQTNNFGAVNPQTDQSAEAVYRLFETANGTHFLTGSYDEYVRLTTPGTSAYRPDLTPEASSTFYEDATQQAGDVAVYRLFDTVHGTQYLTGNQSEFAGLTTAGLPTYRPALTPEGIAFYAPTGSFST